MVTLSRGFSRKFEGIKHSLTVVPLKEAVINVSLPESARENLEGI